MRYVSGLPLLCFAYPDAGRVLVVQEACCDVYTGERGGSAARRVIPVRVVPVGEKGGTSWLALLVWDDGKRAAGSIWQDGR